MKNEKDIPVYESKHSSNILYFVGLDFFTPEVQKAYRNGDVYGAYETLSGKVAVTLHGGRTVKKAKR